MKISTNKVLLTKKSKERHVTKFKKQTPRSQLHGILGGMNVCKLETASRDQFVVTDEMMRMYREEDRTHNLKRNNDTEFVEARARYANMM